jgi:hypothetical protein
MQPMTPIFPLSTKFASKLQSEREGINSAAWYQIKRNAPSLLHLKIMHFEVFFLKKGVPYNKIEQLDIL